MQTAYLNEKGTSLIEILISILLVAIVFTGLLQSSILAIKTNVQNLMRDEAVSIAEQRLNEARNTPFVFLATGSTTTTISRNFRGTQNFPYTAQTNVNFVDAPANNNKQVQVIVNWLSSGQTYTHNVTTIVRRQ